MKIRRKQLAGRDPGGVLGMILPVTNDLIWHISGKSTLGSREFLAENIHHARAAAEQLPAETRKGSLSVIQDSPDLSSGCLYPLGG